MPEKRQRRLSRWLHQVARCSRIRCPRSGWGKQTLQQLDARSSAGKGGVQPRLRLRVSSRRCHRLMEVLQLWAAMRRKCRWGGEAAVQTGPGGFCKGGGPLRTVSPGEGAIKGRPRNQGQAGGADEGAPAAAKQYRTVSIPGNWMHSRQSQTVLGEEPDADAHGAGGYSPTVSHGVGSGGYAQTFQNWIKLDHSNISKSGSSSICVCEKTFRCKRRKVVGLGSAENC